MRNIIACIALVCALGGTGFGEDPVSRVGLEAVYFFPSIQLPDYLGIPDQFDTFRGLGSEIGRVSGHFDLSLEAHWVMAKSASGRWYDYAILYRVTPRVACRLWKRRTPYIGIGSGYQWIRLYGNTWGGLQVIVEENYSSITFEPFAGYDLRLTKRLGLKLEGRYQIVSPSEALFAQGLRYCAGAYIAFGEK